MFNFSSTAWLVTTSLLTIPLLVFFFKLNLFGNFKKKNLILALVFALAIQFIIGVLCWLLNFIPAQMNEPIEIPAALSEIAKCYFTFGLYIYLPFIVLINLIYFSTMIKRYKNMQNNSGSGIS